MSLQDIDIFSLLKDGGIAALFLYLYLKERTRSEKIQDERFNDMRQSMDSLHKSTSVLDEAMRRLDK